MATAQNLEERFQAAVKKIQTLPSDGKFPREKFSFDERSSFSTQVQFSHRT